MKERDIQVRFGKWLKNNPHPLSSAYELKLCKGTSLPFSAVKEHQITALLAVKDGGLYHRITDQPWMKDRPAFTYKKPFDCLWLNKISAYVVVVFYVPRTPKIAYFIDILDWTKEVSLSTRKSITLKRASEIAIFKAVL